MDQIKIRIEKSIPPVTLSLEDKADVEADIEDLYDYQVFRDDLQYLRRVGKIKMKKIAEDLDVWPQNLYRWMAGNNCPRNPYCVVAVRVWARKLREVIAANEREV